MAKGNQLSYKSLASCLKSSKSSDDKNACRKHFTKQTEKVPEGEKARPSPPMNKEEKRVWDIYMSKGQSTHYFLSPNDSTMLDSMIRGKEIKIKKD